MLDALVPARPIQRSSPTSRRGGCAPRSRRSRMRWRAVLITCTRCGSARSSLTWTFSTGRSALTEAIGKQIAPFEPAVELLCTIPGVQRRSAEVIIAEIGVDMTVFPTAGTSPWGGMCPGNDQSAGKRRSGKTRKGSKWLDLALEEAAMAAIRTKDVYLAAQYARLRPRRGHKKALGAVKHSILIACWHMLATGELYVDLGGDYYRKRDPESDQTTRRPARSARPPGHPRGVAPGRVIHRQHPPEGYFPVRRQQKRRELAQLDCATRR